MTPTPFSFDTANTLNRLGMGVMRLTGQPGNFGPYPDWDQGVALLQEAADLGVQVFDSARAYGPGHADRLLGQALGDRPEVFLATKGGVDKPEPGRITVDGRPATLLRQIQEARRWLRRDRIDLFQLHRVDPNTPIERSVEALALAQARGWIAHIGLSNVTRADLDRARAVAPIASVQNRFNKAEQSDADLVDYTASLGIAYLPYGPLGAAPMQYGARLDPGAAMRWLLKRSSNIILIPGTTDPAHLRANVAAVQAMPA
ncbi:aldo/keto reductase [Tropicimonas sp. S265A]|uniref:aldo/keto reductase n=1 Tax=Tropicimonas sp. S265A TaxID=3415134 RepID=UPI003C7D74B5